MRISLPHHQRYVADLWLFGLTMALLACGVVMLASPFESITTLTFVVGIWLIDLLVRHIPGIG